MLAKRIIPCLDVKDGRVVKGKNFMGLNDVASPVELAERYSKSGADELVFYDITASSDGRKLMVEVLKEAASKVFIPLTVGGGVESVDDFDILLKSGADKVSVNSGAIRRPQLIEEAAKKYGNQCVVLSMDVKKEGDRYIVYSKGGRVRTGIDAVEWAKFAEKSGAGEIVVNSIDTDGVKGGFDIEMLRVVSNAVNLPIVASGGAGKVDDFFEVFETVNIDAALGASVFHFNEIDIKDLKKALNERKICVRL